MLTLRGECAMIIDAEGKSHTDISPVDRVAYGGLAIPSARMANHEQRGLRFDTIDGLQRGLSPQCSPKHTEVRMPDTTIPHDDSPRQLSLFDPIQIPLNRGQITIVDPVDADLTSVKWFAQCATGGGYYATRRTERHGKGQAHLLHRVILARILGRSLTSDELTDHINGNKLDNRRCNLRVATKTENRRNVGKRKNNTSGYKGVSWDADRAKWVAQIVVDRKTLNLGRFATPEEAYAVYCEAAKKYHGNFARLE